MVKFMSCLKDLTGFAVGRVYVSTPALYDKAVLDDAMLVVNDEGKSVKVQKEALGNFAMARSAYAVVVRPNSMNVRRGTVVEVLDVSDDGLWRAEGYGYFKAWHFQFVDSAILIPNESVLLELASGRWRKVVSGLKDGKLMLESADANMDAVGAKMAKEASITGCLFPVEPEGVVVSRPVVGCVDADCETGLTDGKAYELRATRQDGCVVIVDDEGKEKQFLASRFVPTY